MKASICHRSFISLLSLFAMAPVSPAASIVWVSDNGAEGSAGTTGTGPDGIVLGAWHDAVSPGAPYVDQGFVDLLINAGHTVTRFNVASRLSNGDHAELNTYDLIIVGAAQNSGAFNPTTSAWNTAITKPMIITKATLIRGTNRLGWVTSDREFDSASDHSTTVSGKLAFLQPAHPIFAGIGQTGGEMNNFCGIIVPFPERNRGISTQVASFSVDDADQGLSNPPAPGGIVLATQAFNPLDPGVNIPAGGTPTVYPNYKAVGYSIIELPAGTTVGAGQVLAGHRIQFACGTRDASNSPSQTSAPNPQVGALDITPDGQRMFVQAVRYALLQQPPTGPNTWTNTSGDFQWNSTSANWSAPATWTGGDNAIFASTGAGAISLTEAITARHVFVGATGYSFTGGNALTLAGTTPTFTVNAPISLGISLQGTDGFTFQGTSSLTLEASNSFTGGTFVRSGTLILRAPSTGNNPSPYAVDRIEAIDAGATVQQWAATPVEPLTNASLVRATNGQIYRFSKLHLNGGTLDLNGEDSSTQWPAPTGSGTITNSSPYARAAFRIAVSSGQTKTFSGIIQNGNGGVVTTSVVPNSAPGVTPVTYKQGYRMDLDLQSMQDDSAVFVLDNVNTFTGFTRIGGGRLTFTSKGKWGAIVVTGEPTTSTPNGSVICNGNTGNLRVDFNGTSQVTGGLSGNGGVFANNLAGSCSILTVGAGNISNTAWPTGGGGQNGKITDNTTGVGGMIGLTKIGTGTIGLPTAQNDYSGPTTVNNGVLEFTSTGAPSSRSDHQINSPGTIKLSFAGSRNVNSLFLNGSKLPPGIYDAASHPAFITGGGSITVAEVHPAIVPAQLTITRSGGSSTATWNGCGLLQVSTDLTAWTDLPDAVSPHVSPDSGPRKFWRLR